MQPQPSLVGSILERKATSPPSAPASKASGQAGFPAVQHRSKSAFARARDDSRRVGSERTQQVPIVQSTSIPGAREFSDVSGKKEPQDWRRQVAEDNRRRVEVMTEEEREHETYEILERFGPSVGEVLKKARQAREAKQKEVEIQTNKALSSPKTGGRATPTVGILRPSSPPGSTSSTRPSSRTDRRIRFADVTPDDVYFYESAPPSPRKKALALPPPTEADGPTISLGEWKKNSLSSIRRRESLDEGAPEDIRRRFFPSAPTHDPSLEWIESGPSSSQPSTLRFDLTGTPISPSLSSTLPTHLGLHHHADGQHAGYTLDDIFLLSRSTVPAQRATMLGILARIARKLAKGSGGEAIKELVGKEPDLRRKILAAGVEAMSERGSLGVRAVEVIWECIVGWDEEVVDIEGVELQDLDPAKSSFTTGNAAGPLATLPLEYVLPQISSAFSMAALPPECLTQLLAVVHRLAQHSNDMASKIVSTSGLVANIYQTFLLTPIPPTDASPLPDPSALRFLDTLAQSSRANAAAIMEPADSLLRFVTILPPVSPFSISLATSLLAGTLRLYTTLASYGLYAHIATTAQEHLAQLSRYVLSDECQSKRLREAWIGVLEAWLVCATDPHRTTPSHEILWSQVVGWGWGEEVLEARSKLTAEEDGSAWTALWRAESAFLEGAVINGVKGGEGERSAVLNVVREGFESGVERRIVEFSERELRSALANLTADSVGVVGSVDIKYLRAAASHANTLAAALRLWLSCLPSHLVGPPDSPPFLLPFSRTSELCATLVSHRLWSSVDADESPPYLHVYCRPLSLLLSRYLRLSRRLPGMSPDLWTAQALAILCRVLPGDEEFAYRTVEEITGLITADFIHSHGWHVPDVIWAKGGLDIITPFITHSVQSKLDVHIGPLWMSPQSLSTATTQALTASFCTPA
ncbi:RNA polymerase II-associated protein 1 [Grifola frondosa]|uniref:RNA polymerase II-associated protein 1 n=1 Tax=Grifola frondosa TaxID=5627 RepID=A0A1C7M3P9_GRIFR|nr:RNA polymerase II-associated protein 1 [Grifola frondosa]